MAPLARLSRSNNDVNVPLLVPEPSARVGFPSCAIPLCPNEIPPLAAGIETLPAADNRSVFADAANSTVASPPALVPPSPSESTNRMVRFVAVGEVAFVLV